MYEGRFRRDLYGSRQGMHRKGEIHITRGRIYITTDREHMIVKTSIEPILVCLICGRFD